MFQVVRNNTGTLKTVEIKNLHTKEHVSFIPEFGGNINKLVLAKEGSLYSLIEGNQSRAQFEGSGVFKGAKLIPFPNRLEDGAYFFEGKQYQLQLNYPAEHNACHGFVYDKGFSVEKTKEGPESAFVRLLYQHDGSLPGYPFPCKVELTYVLDSREGFKCRTKIENLSEGAMPVGDGWHPFFTFHKKIDKAFLKLPRTERISANERMLPVGEAQLYNLFESFTKIEDTNFDTCFKIKPETSGVASIELYDFEQEIKVSLWMETGENKYNYFQLYIPPERTSIAIEPMTCNVNAFNNQEGLITLKPQEKFIAEYGVKLS